MGHMNVDYVAGNITANTHSALTATTAFPVALGVVLVVTVVFGLLFWPRTLAKLLIGYLALYALYFSAIILYGVLVSLPQAFAVIPSLIWGFFYGVGDAFLKVATPIRIGVAVLLSPLAYWVGDRIQVKVAEWDEG